MATALRVLVHGASGRVGQRLLALVLGDPRFELVGALVRPQSALHGAAVAAGHTLCYSHQWPEHWDVLIDFSLPIAFDEMLDRLEQRPSAAWISGTTGLSAVQEQRMQALAQRHAVLWASNFSLGAAVLHRLVREARRLLPAEFECAVFESHHSAKRDAPSGTALTLAAAAQSTDGAAPQISSLRAGQIIGEHEVYFAGPAERLELVHRAGDRSLFARGALSAAAWLAGRPAGRYQIDDVLVHS